MTTIAKTAAEEVYADLDNLPDGFADVRRNALAKFEQTGLPHRRIEEWKWTDLRRIVDQAYPPVSDTTADDNEVDAMLAARPFKTLTDHTAVFVNGRFDAERSNLPTGISVETFAATTKAPDFNLHEGDVVDTLNIAYASDGALINVAAPADETAALDIVYINTLKDPATVTLRNTVDLAENTSLKLFETQLGGETAYVFNNVTETRLRKDARLDRVRVQDDGKAAINLSNNHVALAQTATLRDFTLTTGAKTVRNQGFVRFDGEEAKVNISGAYMIAGKQHVDTTLNINHAVPACESRELFKCVMDENARGIFQGKVIVARDAQKTDGQQTANALLLSEGAEFDAKPELEIYADDVWCGHGATSGELDENQLFYLKARGIPEAKAKALLIAAFATAAFEEVEDEATREVLTEIATGWMDTRKTT